jgi:nitrite reductase/ring-hydroxylating ferredoxin subunit
MSKPASIPEQSLAENELFLRDVPVAGGLRVAQVVAVFRVGDKLCATQARCPHRGGPLYEGHLDAGTLTCSWHGARFDVCTGALLRGPAQTPLETYHVTATSVASIWSERQSETTWTTPLTPADS